MIQGVLISLLLLFPQLTQGDDDTCGDGLPCGPIPWALPVLPALPSPTPFPTVLIEATATPTIEPETTAEPTALPTVTPTAIPSTPTPTPTADSTAISDTVDDLEDLVEVTPEVISIDDVEYGVETAALDGNSSTVIGYIRGLFSVRIGKMDAVIVAGGVAFFTVMGVKSITFILPIIAVMIGAVRKVVTFVLRFIPGLG